MVVVFPEIGDIGLVELVSRRCKDVVKMDFAKEISGLDLSSYLLTKNGKGAVQTAHKDLTDIVQESWALKQHTDKKRTVLDDAVVAAGGGRRAKPKAQAKREQAKSWRGIRECPAGSITQKSTSQIGPQRGASGGIDWEGLGVAI